MLITPQKVEVTWNGGNRKHFESLGYVYTKRGDAFEVDVSELLEGSKYEVQVECDFCHEIFLYPYSKYLRAMNNRIGKVSCSSTACKQQLKHESAKTMQFTIDEVRAFFEEHGCVLLEDEYKGYRVPMRFRCRCGREDEKSLEKFKTRTSSCRYCAVEHQIEKSRLSYEEVYQYFKDHHCELLEKSYKNNNTPLRYICECGNEAFIRFDSFKQGNRCAECAKRKRAEARRHSYEYVQQIFEQEGCTLLEETYKDGHTPMRYLCKCGREDYKSLFKFLDGQRCRACYLENNRRENNPAWNPNKTDEEREQGRILEGYKQWKKDCLFRDNYTCQSCGKRGGTMHIHHIFGYSMYPEFRIEPLNGITLCVDCHKGSEGFHGIYGNYKTTPDEFLEFLKCRGNYQVYEEVKKRIEWLYKHLQNPIK